MRKSVTRSTRIADVSTNRVNQTSRSTAAANAEAMLIMKNGRAALIAASEAKLASHGVPMRYTHGGCSDTTWAPARNCCAMLMYFAPYQGGVGGVKRCRCALKRLMPRKISPTAAASTVLRALNATSPGFEPDGRSFSRQRSVLHGDPKAVQRIVVGRQV